MEVMHAIKKGILPIHLARLAAEGRKKASACSQGGRQRPDIWVQAVPTEQSLEDRLLLPLGDLSLDDLDADVLLLSLSALSRFRPGLAEL